MDDYYELLGVESDAQTEDIRVAYRDRKAALDNTTESGREEARRLNKAWNVLSDPYQRGRYDAQLDNPPADGDDIEVIDDTPARKNGSSSSKSSSSKPMSKAEQRAKAREVGPPTIDLPAGTHWPKTKNRIIAMVIDLLVLLVFYVSFSLIGHAVASNQHPGTYKQIDDLTSLTTGDEQKAIDSAQKDLDNAKKTNASNQQELQQKLDQAKATQKADQKKLDDERGKVAGTESLFAGIGFLIGGLYLIIPSIFTGRTLGKRTQHLKVLREDGSKLRAGDAIKRYGALVLVVYAGSITPLGIIIPAVVLYAVLRWMRNNNMQGVHDRFAHTIVVSDAAE
jgi:curved DNA-binding protein CbpA